MKAMKRLIACTVCLLLALMLIACAPAEEAAPVETVQPAAEETPAEEPAAAPAEAETAGEEAPAAATECAITFRGTDLAGNDVDDSLISGSKVTVLNFWATWCGPCISEIPGFSSVAAAYADKGVAFLGVQLDDDMEAARDFWSGQGITYPTILPDGTLTDMANEMMAIPVTILVDAAGSQIGETVIGSIDEATLTGLIDDALATVG